MTWLVVHSNTHEKAYARIDPRDANFTQIILSDVEKSQSVLSIITVGIYIYDVAAIYIHIDCNLSSGQNDFFFLFCKVSIRI